MAADTRDASLQVMLERARQLLHENHLDDADAIFARILEQGPMQADALIGRARVALNKGSPADAASFLRSVLADQPDHAEACFGLAVVSQSQGHLDEAANWYQRTTQLRSGDAAAFYNLGVVRHEQGQLAEAEEAYRQASKLDRGFYQPLINLGNILLLQGRLEAAAENYRRALGLLPNSVEALHGLGMILQKQGRIEEAEKLFRAAISKDPEYSPALFSIGVIHHDRMELEQAMEWYARALRVGPGQVDVLFNLAKAYQDLGRHAEAERIYTRLLPHVEQIQRNRTSETGVDEIFYNLSLVLRKQNKWEAWFENHQQFARVTSDSVILALDGVTVSRYRGDIEHEKHYLGELTGHEYTSKEIDILRAVLALLPYFDVTQESVFRLYRQFDLLMVAKAGVHPALKLPMGPAGARLRIGYLSPDFRRHVMGYMMLEVISRHDAENFDIYCYSLNSGEDEVTRAIRDKCKKFQVIKGMRPRSAAELIAQDNLDILVDLVTHTEGAVPEILAYKPARVQITSIASSGALGLATVDYKLTDQYCDPPDNQRYLIEKLLPMAGCVYPYRHLPPASTAGYGREALGIAKDAIVIGAFVNIVKLSPRCLSLWRRTIERLPRSVLAFSPNSDQEISAYRLLAVSSGLDLTRVVFVPNNPDAAIARTRYTLVDMVLDTLPYGGVNGTIEALDMGVPVVTLLGNRHGERTSYSILKNLGVDGTIACSEDEYVAIAVRLAEDGTFRSAVQDAIRRGLRDSPLVNMAAHVAHLEDAYHQAVADTGVL